MADLRQILTDKAVARLPYAKEKQYKVRDTEVAGFFVLIGKRRKSFMAQGEFWRDGVREFAAQVKLGEFGDLSTREARSKAKDALGSIARGQRPGESPRSISGSVTLRQAWERYRDAHMRRKGRNAGTIENYRDHMERLFANWLDKPLARLGRQPNSCSNGMRRSPRRTGLTSPTVQCVVSERSITMPGKAMRISHP